MNKTALVQKEACKLPSVEEFMSFSKDKIFLEPIDQYFEEESNNEECIQEGEVDLKKLDDELSKCLLLDNNDEVSTSMESEEMNKLNNENFNKVRIIKMSDFLIISQEKINKCIKDTINEYYWIIQNKNQGDQK